MRIFLVLLPILMFGQSTRNVVLNWTASTSSGVLGYQVSRALLPAGPFTLLTPAPISAVTFTDQGGVGQTYTYQVVTVAAPCTPTTPVSQACGTSAPAQATTNVPPLPAVTATITVIVP